MLKLVILVLPLLVHSAPVRPFLPLDCEDLYNNGSVHNDVYTIYPAGAEKPVQVFCDMGCTEGGGHVEERWTVIQRRVDGNLNFNRPWQQYKDGFGDASGEYWLGLENIFIMTYRERYELRVDMEDFEQGTAYAQYTSFYIDPESQSYTLHISGYINGGAGDPLSAVNAVIFSTPERSPYGQCADTYLGGFWYTCWPTTGLANPNGLYKWVNVPGSTPNIGVLWGSWKPGYSLKKMAMKIRRVTLADLQNL
ncbi:microfibril-associated glycoprotein 4-like [Trichomycterus rosablanca]|uniref:microfibril-associated glycoprotein 4-like n=1 Tax=Trichomycterus rosablanca TaxID=2290929 RepID=UPI002F357C36